jgi:transposase
MVEIRVTTQELPVRSYGDRPARVIQSNSVQLSVTLDEAAVANTIRRMGWRVYVTNQPPEELSLSRAVVAYREEYLIERGFGRFKGFPLSLRPMYLQREDHIKGLIRLLSIGLRVLTLLEFQVRRRLASLDEKLAGLYAGNPQRATARPTAEKLLAAFKEITLLLIEGPNQTYVHLTPLSPLQQQILALLELPLEIYTQLEFETEEPP